ncbi:MAG: transcription-repair coupling factor [Oscillospiraceae bacterium]|nr:transcription-repair coupling factor [Oscillospiraceae bacterium]MDD4412991.1 transcription-repair coupling factor [Oscillospiraceae bacterium]
MNVLNKGLTGLAAFQSLCADIGAGRLPASVTGLGHIHKIHFISALSAALGRRAVLLTADEGEAAKVCEDAAALGMRAVFFPARDLSLRSVESVSREFEQQRLGALSKIMSGEYDIVVAAVDAAAQFTLPPDVLRSRTITLREGLPLPVKSLPAALVAAGYERCDQIEGAGQFAVRGGIFDIFPAACPSPVRVELWGDTVDTIGYYDIITQRRTQPLKIVSVTPAAEVMPDNQERLADDIEVLASELKGKSASAARELLLADASRLRGGGRPASFDKYIGLIYKKPATLFDYTGYNNSADVMLFVSETARVRERLRTAVWQLEEDIKALLAEGQLCRGLTEFMLDSVGVQSELEKRGGILLDTFARTGQDIYLKSLYNINARQLPAWSGGLDLLADDLKNYMNRNMACIVLAGSEVKNAKMLADDLVKRGIPALYAPSPQAPVKNRVLVLQGGLSAGMEYPEAGFAVITHGRIGSERRKVRRRRHDKAAEIHNLTELTPGDYIVHAAHGIGLYQGIHPLEVQGVIKDYIKIEYDKGDTLYVPVTQLDLVSKYIGTKDDVRVRLHRLGGQEWQKTKARVRTAVKDIARQLIQLYAQRMSSPGFAFEPDGEWQYDFERRFEYEETDDQLRCVEEIKSDMERTVPMDRLLCGDVGFGKTEVALRAAFKCVTQSKQCVLLVPTTILAFQHYNTIIQRFDGFPVRVDMLSRFRTPKQQEQTIKKLANGEVDIVVGTHRILSKDIKFYDIGLIIVDEEQRFGVAQKERLNEAYPNVDVLTLSATPIPRTLNMAMSGIRDMSIIEEAPQDRHPVQTYVLEYDTGILSDAIRRELRRGGQVYYLHNRTETIERCAASIQMRIPEARVGFAHGKMGEEQLSDIWKQMLEHEIDVLVCTTIIEAGVDVPNANTLIIENADRFGLSQLHQLRGRVGRSARRAFAYLSFVRGKVLTDVATKRLEAVREFTEFGAGFKIAMRDMEIRGAGNILGAQQHGHMEAVGYEMYLRLLGEAVNEEKGIPDKNREAECLIDLQVTAHIPEDYISSTAQRLDIYRRIADIRSHEDSLDVYDELIDRFGDPPEAVQGLIDVAMLRNMAADIGVYEVNQKQDSLLLYMRHLDMQVGSRISSALKGRVMISAGAKPYIAVKVRKGFTPLDTLREALEACRPDDTANDKTE